MKAHRSSRHRSVKQQFGRDADRRQCAVGMKGLLLGVSAKTPIRPGEPGPRSLVNEMEFARAAECAAGQQHGGFHLKIVRANVIKARLLECVDYLIDSLCQCRAFTAVNMRAALVGPRNRHQGIRMSAISFSCLRNRRSGVSETRPLVELRH